MRDFKEHSFFCGQSFRTLYGSVSSPSTPGSKVGPKSEEERKLGPGAEGAVSYYRA